MALLKHRLAILVCVFISIIRAQSSPDAVVVFNEIHYNPSGNDEKGEWVELFNQMGIMTDVSGWKIDGIGFTIPENTFINPGEYLVIAKEPGPNQLGPFTGNINNAGETLRLFNKGNRLMDELSFNDGGRWPEEPDGSGVTLSKIYPYNSNTPPENWTFSSQVGGTPGTINFPRDDSEIPSKNISLIQLEDEWLYNESGENLGSQWATSSHNEQQGWLTGKGGIGFESGSTIPISTRLSFPGRNDPYVVTYYFEKEFNLKQNELENLKSLIIRHAIDDGALVHINGIEVLRVNMPDGIISSSTLAANNIEVDELSENVFIDSSSLIAGQNRISVEVHQSRIGNSDVVFGIELDVEVTEPRNSSSEQIFINEIPPANEEIFWIELINEGTGPANLEGIVLTVGADPDREYRLPSQSINAGEFFVINEETLGFRPESGEKIFVYNKSMSSVLDSREQTNRLRGRASEKGGKWLFPQAPSPLSKNQFSFNDQIVISEICYNPPGLPAIKEVPPTFESINLVPFNSVWRFDRSGIGQPQGWQQSIHPLGGRWEQGIGPIGRETGSLPIPLQTAWSRDEYSSGTTTYYFETYFNVSAEIIRQTDELVLNHLIDDGAIFYLNGTEIARFNMPVGPISPNQLASSTVSNATLKTLAFPGELLQLGQNLLSVETHQGSASSSDMVFGASLETRIKTSEGSEGIPYRNSRNQWIEIANRSNQKVSLEGWNFSDGIDFKFKSGTFLDPGEHACLVEDKDLFVNAYPNSKIIGEFNGALSRSGERIILRDQDNNPVDEVRYYDSGRWPSNADGGGSTIELLDFNADNQSAEAWASSNETNKTSWKSYTYRGTASSSRGPDSQWREFNIGLLDAGEILIDDINVIEDPDGRARQILRNTNFSEGTNHWRLRGTHRKSEVINDPDDPNNKVLKIRASSATGHMHNQIETTLLSQVRNGTEYEISFKARWVSGTNLIHSRLYFNRLAKTTTVERPSNIGSPSQPNPSRLDNLGPTYEGLIHSPAVPSANEIVNISLEANDPDGISSMRLFYSVNGRSFKSVSMGRRGTKYEATVPAQSRKSVVQFYVQGKDSKGNASYFPKDGPDSRALYKVDDGLAATNGWHNFRIVITNEDRDFIHTETEVMSNGRVGVTIIDREDDIYYDVQMRLKGSERARSQDPRVGYNFNFGRDQLYRGIHKSLAIDRSEGVGSGQIELLFDIMIANSGGVVSRYYDFIKVMAPLDKHTRGATLQMARYDEVFLKSQFGDDGDGNLFEYELIYYPTTTNGSGLKRPQPDGVTGTSVINLGDDPEKYRWFYLKKNNREANDFEPIMNYAKLFSRSNSDFEDEIEQVVHVDHWLRGMSYAVLSGAGDNAGAGSQHNGMYYAFPDGRVMFLPHDMDFAFDANRSITANPECRRITQNDSRKRIYYGHLHDIISTTYNIDYMSKWVNHLRGFDPNQNWSNHLNYINSRSRNVLSQIRSIREINFSIQTPGTIQTANNSVKIEGKGWVNVKEIRIKDSPNSLPIEWTDSNTWNTSLPVSPGRNSFTLEAIDYSGKVVGTDNVTIVSSSDSEPASKDNVVISEIMYNPSPLSDQEIAAGFIDKDQFEFIEIMNIAENATNLQGVRFINGIDYEFQSSIVLDPGGRLIIAKDRLAFLTRYPDKSGSLASGNFKNGTSLSNGGERLHLIDLATNNIKEFSFDDKSPWPEKADGEGFSLVLIQPQTNPDHSTFNNWAISASIGGSPGNEDPNELFNPANTDDDKDGLNYFAESTLGSSDQVPNSPFTISFDSQRYLVVKYSKKAEIADTSIKLETSTDLVSWQGSDGTFIIQSESPNEEGLIDVIMRSSTPLAGARYLRLKIEKIDIP